MTRLRGVSLYTRPQKKHMQKPNPPSHRRVAHRDFNPKVDILQSWMPTKKDNVTSNCCLSKGNGVQTKCQTRRKGFQPKDIQTRPPSIFKRQSRLQRRLARCCDLGTSQARLKCRKRSGNACDIDLIGRVGPFCSNNQTMVVFTVPHFLSPFGQTKVQTLHLPLEWSSQKNLKSPGTQEVSQRELTRGFPTTSGIALKRAWPHSGCWPSVGGTAR